MTYNGLSIIYKDISVNHLKQRIICSVALAITFAGTSSNSCTSVFSNQLKAPYVVARTMDFYTNDLPDIVVSPRGIARNGEAGSNSLHWTSKYGNVAITAFHTSAVSDGINEHGLSVHLLYLTNTMYEKRDDKTKALSNALWAQYLLDNYKTVADALKAQETLQIVPTKIEGREWPLHLSMEDATGDSAVIEFVHGKRKIYHGHEYNVMTNEPAYDIQLSNRARYLAFGGKLPLPGDSDPLSRFVRASTYLKTLPSPKNALESLAGIFSVIRTVTVPFGAIDTSGNETVDAWVTRWMTVADVTNKVYYFNSTSAPNIVWLELGQLNFQKGQPVLSADPTDIRLVGDISKHLVARDKLGYCLSHKGGNPLLI